MNITKHYTEKGMYESDLVYYNLNLALLLNINVMSTGHK